MRYLADGHRAQVFQKFDLVNSSTDIEKHSGKHLSETIGLGTA